MPYGQALPQELWPNLMQDQRIYKIGPALNFHCSKCILRSDYGTQFPIFLNLFQVR